MREKLHFLVNLFTFINPIQDGLFGAAHRWEGGAGQKGPSSLKSVTHSLQWWNLAQLYITYGKSKKYINHVTLHLISADISIFSPEISKFFCIKKHRYRLDFDTQFLIFKSFLESLIIVLINIVAILMMSSKMASPGLLKLKIFWNKGYDVINPVHDVTTKFLSCYSNYIVDVVIWSKFGNCNISIKKVIITSIL